jgi:hypothetical protein
MVLGDGGFDEGAWMVGFEEGLPTKSIRKQAFGKLGTYFSFLLSFGFVIENIF